MTYCLGIRTQQGLVMASDSRTNSGIDQVEVCRKMHNFVVPGERMFTILSSGSLSLTQSVMTRLEQEFRAGEGLATVANFYEASRCVGGHVRDVASLDRDFLERDKIGFTVNLLIGGQIRGEHPQLYMVYAQGNPLRCTRLSPYLQIGESKYGRPILDRTGRIIAFELAQDDIAAGCIGLAGQPLQAHQRRLANDLFDGRVIGNGAGCHGLATGRLTEGKGVPGLALPAGIASTCG